jgi:hypothetical protein
MMKDEKHQTTLDYQSRPVPVDGTWCRSAIIAFLYIILMMITAQVIVAIPGGHTRSETLVKVTMATLWSFVVLTSVCGIVFGTLALVQIKRSEVCLRGKWLALVAVLLGAASMAGMLGALYIAYL